MKTIKTITRFFFFSLLIFSLNGCNKDQVTGPDTMTDDEYITEVVAIGYDNNLENEDNIMSVELRDLDDGGAINDNDNNPPAAPIDSLKRWGRKITGVNVNFSIENTGDSLKSVQITRTITGNYIIIGYHNGGQIDSVTKPYTEVFHRNVIFKRVARTEHPRYNWRLYKVSNLDGGTTLPQAGSSQVQITKVEFYKNGILAYSVTGPDFENVYFTTKLFGGEGIPKFDRGDQVTVKIFTLSQQSAIDYVAWHWARNTFGFHRVPFTLESQTGNGPFDRVYTKTINIYNEHLFGTHNGFISASTRESLYDDDNAKFASDQIGIPYKVLR